ncbi:MAG: hypothetical protein OSA89_19975 [Mariniblastus sp.]|nr:hypothetical protein [Mariniblastus sp.]
MKKRSAAKRPVARIENMVILAPVNVGSREMSWTNYRTRSATPQVAGKPVNRLTDSVTLKIQRLPNRQLAVYDACHPESVFAEGLAMNVTQGYELQNAVAQ